MIRLLLILASLHPAPDDSAILRPGVSVAFSDSCEYSDFQAYGPGIRAQHWTRAGLAWNSTRGGRVVWNGLSFRNTTRHRVLVGAWCVKEDV